MTEVPSPAAPLPPHLPSSTYRLQLHAGFDFAAARRLLPYLARLGVTEVYLSPVWTSTPGSTHGYDVTDHAQVNPALGGEAGLRRLSARARELGLGLILDFVPNHMGIQGGHNPYWEDVLTHGQASRYAHFFDISWQPLKRALENKVLLPVLGEQYGRVLERGELVLHREGGTFFLTYWERRLPVSPRTLAGPLTALAAELVGLLPAADHAELASVARAAANLPVSTSADLTDEDRLARAQESEVITRRLGTLAEASRPVRAALDRMVTETNADPARLDALIQDQNYRLASWRVAAEQINYRRFFDINDLAALRMEDPRVFDWAHAKLFELIGDGVVTGVRLDHTDGLYDPAGYFRALQRGAARALGREWRGEEGEALPLYVVAEKILEPGEALPGDWAIHGTTGYDFLAQLGGTFVEAGHEEEVTAIYRRFTGDRASYGEHLYAGKHLIQRVSLPGEVNVLAEHLERLAEADLRFRDFTLSQLREVIRETIASFPVYRTYVREGGSREPGDDAKIEHAVREAKAHRAAAGRDLDPSLFDFLSAVLRLDAPGEATRARYADFALKFQQLTGPVTAKGAEDTAFYRYARLLSLNEVGGDPALFGTPPRAFHAAARARQARWPHAMLAASTHDTKRGEDTRARISVLSELPQTWAAYLSGWSPLIRSLEQDLDTGRAPAALDTYTLLQTVLGAYPLDGRLEDFGERLSAYLLKAAREAKLRTSWAAPDGEYEAALEHLVRGLLGHERFLSSLGELHARISTHGAQNGLSATLVRLTAPGVPDTYQGCEGWNQSLVDPDNRRPVDYPARARLLARIEKRWPVDGPGLAADLLARYPDGGVKLLVTWAALRARRAHPELFRHGGYRPIEAGKYLLAFAREHADEVAVTVAPRLTLTLTREKAPWALGEVWGNRQLTLPRPGSYRNVLTGERLRVRGQKVPVAKVLETFPLALLVRE
ncbi:malto-oligosyltrehalose synthase [Deinococcus budaensis]|uniref:(1->4)-alpha-D-glucan 1-alpha-D-glucosylmutase n=1 Tax=Deinococcus budaensis TaxID=1665626 RepID=A0A7W8LQY5_9DEIO|nr:malto-oligosyltrehalose synthase [Deinococcus budaensis]MBB5235326.1 (1->4)-alpha-D-glucan 1-alpha-D-glucosylmutase [Deinococcus budaensis]